MIRAAAIAVAALGLSACAIGNKDFACKGYPQGVTCMSAIDVYEATNGEYTRQPLNEGKGKTVAPQSGTRAAAIAAADATRNRTIQFGGNLPPPDRPIPLLSEPEVMRILFAPWKDGVGNLIAPGLVFAEVTPRTWNIGIAPTANTRALYNVAADGTAVDGPVPATNASGSTPGRAQTILPPSASATGGADNKKTAPVAARR